MNHPVETIGVIYLGVGLIYVFGNPRYFKELAAHVRDTAPNAGIAILMSSVLSIGLVLIVCTWPIWLTLDIADLARKK
jgi:hypothetical protein